MNHSEAHVAINELVHTYADAVVHRNGQQWGSCWAEQSRWVLSPERTVEGRDAIVDLWHRAMTGFSAVVQLVHNGAIDLAAGGTSASGRWYIDERFKRTDGSVGILLAHYDDTYTYEAGRWLFASRELTKHYHGAPDLSDVFSNASGA
jgi:SnoaL-like domain